MFVLVPAFSIREAHKCSRGNLDKEIDQGCCKEPGGTSNKDEANRNTLQRLFSNRVRCSKRFDEKSDSSMCG